MAAVLPLDPSASAGSPRPASARKAGRQRGFAFGKYREIIIAVAFFLLFDLGVLVLNFYTSFKIDQDTVAINLAGRQRYVSQRIARTLLELDAARASGKAFKPETLAELRAGAKIFDISATAFKEGATVPGGDSKPVFLAAVTSNRGRELEAQVDVLWKPYFEKLQPLLRNDNFTPEQLAEALNYSQANNIKLLNIANDFVTETQQIGASRASTLRMVQTGGIVLALLNFAFILFKFLHRLRTSDAAIEAANEENREILTSVREGLFLITPDFKIGSQLSHSAHALFGRTLTPGQDLFTLLQPLLPEKVLADARDYVQLLFAPHVKEALVQGINPLSEVEAAMKNRLGQDVVRHLSFHFNRVQEGGGVRHLLVTVQDISARVELERKLQAERHRSQKEFAMLLKAIDADPAMLRQFVARAEANLLEVNDLLRSTSSAQGEQAILKRIDEARRRVHAVKGDAGTLGLDTIASQAHLFETELERIRQGGGSGDLGSALLALPLPLEDLLNKIASLKSLTGLQRPVSDELASGESMNTALGRLAADVARDAGKQVQPTIAVGGIADLPQEQADLVREIAVQLLRNAIVHGVEAPATRAASGKAEAGKVNVQLTRGETEWVLSVRDDGAGLSAPRIRRKLLELGWYTAAQLESFDDRQIVAHIFKPGFSTAGGVTLHAGRGVGLDVVQANTQKLGARLTLGSTPGEMTEFKVRFAA
jgi:two-component system chemotaxis sensor kinase CheA